MIDVKNIDFNALKRLFSPQGVKDLDTFLDGLPLNAGYNALVAAGIAWIIAGCMVFFTVLQLDDVSRLRAELAEVEALRPPVPRIDYAPVPDGTLKDLQEKIKNTYKGIGFSGSASGLTISASDTDYFPQFLAAINFLQNGGRNWRVSLTKMCVGRDCGGSKLSATVKVEAARVSAPVREEKK